MKTKAYRFDFSIDKFTETEHEISITSEFDLIVEVSHCGLCFSDLHILKAQNGNDLVIPGHEIVGTVVEVGSKAIGKKAGDRIGIGWRKTACMNCSYCLAGMDNLCPKRTKTCIGDIGGFSHYVKLDSRFVFDIPPYISSIDASPMFCSGATAHSAIIHANLNKNSKVCIIGIGGIGHLAIQIAKHFSFFVSAFSSNYEKRCDCLALGADDFSIYSEMYKKKYHDKFDLIIITSPHFSDYKQCLDMLAPSGQLCLLSLSENPINISSDNLIHKGLKIYGIPNSSSRDINRLFEIQSKGIVKPYVEIFEFSKINDAVSRMTSGKLRYKAVLQWS